MPFPKPPMPSSDLADPAAAPPFDFLRLKGKPVLVTGVANKKSVAWHTATLLAEAGAEVKLAVHTAERREKVRRFSGDLPVYLCDVADQPSIDRLAADLADDLGGTPLAGLVHSVAYADYSAGWLPFHETPRAAFLQAVDISCFSLTALSNALSDQLDPETGSVVTISISTTRMAAENYGYMAPVKAALDSSVCFLAKSFSKFSKVRFNAVGPGLLKTQSSAGIPGYLDSYLFAERATLRGEAVSTPEVANAVAFLLSPRSSGINAQHVTIDGGMGVNYFDADLVRDATR